MPLKYQRPYIPRIYMPRAQAGGARGGSMGNIGADITKAISGAIQANRQNAIANRLMNTQNPPRAGLVAPGVNPQTGQANVIPAGTPTGGTSPITGGVDELQMRQQLQQQNLADQLQQAKIAAQLALVRQRSAGARGAQPGGSGSAARWQAYLGGGQQPGGQQPGGRGAAGGRAAKPAAYQPGTGDVQNDPATDNFNQIRADFDAQHGKGAFDTFSKNVSNLQDDKKGNLVLTNPDTGQPVLDKNGLPAFSIPSSDAPFWTQRYNAARIASGQGYLGNLPAGTNPNSGQPSGSQVNPIQVQDNLGLRSLPYGTWMQMPDGSIQQKQPLNPQTGAQPAQPQTSLDTGAGQNVATNAPLPQLTQTNQPLPADQNVGANAPLPQLSQPPPAGAAMMPQLSNVVAQGLPTSMPTQNVAAVSPMAAGQSYLNTLGLGAGAGQLYPAGDLYG